MTAIAAVLALPRFALANPTGGTVVEGAASISSAGSVTNINQATNKAIINWQGFSIGVGETVNFYQPSALSVTLNRVVGNEQSVIAGALNANGRVFIVNSAGVLFTKDAQVNVGGLVASTFDISNSNFMAGNYTFSGSSSAAVVNQGAIKASEGGYVALLGKTVSNEGTIAAKLGTIALASGEQITLNFGGDSLVDVTIDKGTLNALVENKGLIKANGGQVVLTAKAADDLLSAQVNNSGIIKARTLADLTGGSSSSGTVKIGKIKLLASGGTVNVSGRLDASAPKGGKGGTIETSGNKVTVADGAVVTTASASGETGSWIIDPDGFSIAATGGDITGATLSGQLGSNNVTILSTSGNGSGGNVDVNDVVSWAANTTLTLNATNAINVNAVLTGSGTSSGLALKAGTDINVNAPSSLQVASLTATAGGNVNFNAQQVWNTAGAWTFAGSNINVNDAVSWSTGTLTLNAASFINLNAVMTASNQASLVATYNAAIDTTTDSKGMATSTYGTPLGGFNPLYNSATGTYVGRIDFVNNTAANPLTINGNKYTLITSMSQLDALDGKDASVAGAGTPSSVSGNYALASDLDACGAVSATCASAVTYSNALISLGASGVLEGLGHNIANLTITANTAAGLIRSNSGVVRDLSLTNVNETIKFGSPIGTLLGNNLATGRVFNVSASGSLNVPNTTATATSGWTVANDVGGLVGRNGGLIYGARANVNITAINATDVGGLVGNNLGGVVDNTHKTGVILNSTASGNVTVDAANWNYSGGLGYIGGFVGVNNGGSIYSSSSSGAVTVWTQDTQSASITGVGAFAGGNVSNLSLGASIGSSVTTGNVIVLGGAISGVGGFAGYSFASSIANSSSFGKVSIPTGPTYNGIPNSISNVGGFAGWIERSSTLSGDTYNATASGQGSAVGTTSSSAADVTSTTATGPSSGQGAPTSTAAQTAASARATAAGLAQQATSQQQAVATVARAVAQRIAETRQAASAAGNVVANDARLSSSTPPNPASSTAGKKAVEAAVAAAKFDDNVKIEEPPVPASEKPKRVQRQAAAETRHKAHSGGRGGYGARIRSIDVDGQHFDLGNDRKDKTPDQKAQ